ncbi:MULTISPECIES: competence type IV pilus major pilin ComGC [Selenomonas]|uniref:Type II secretion system protein n=1 Tax=Selenomonas timonae TaxID=2754044 RepID=A0A7G7VKB6_9FIRM|nr:MULTISPECIES: type II secretion system protein [Selenomonas]EKX99396.1 prepilin-type cleavage/methylation protein [Selenomonas sp. oral taxon 138 str. F0429]QNH54559.1 type II secretion system protein [Selenomonas timonae]
MQSAHTQRGFSLLSTLLAVMILAVILAIAVPRFTSAIATANTVKVQADLTALDTAIVLYQTAKGKNPSNLDDLAEYVTDLKNLKPPSGNVLVGGKEESMEKATYKIEQKNNVWRATCAGRTAEEYRTKE